MARRKSTLACNEMIQKPVPPIYEYEVFIALDNDKNCPSLYSVYVYAQAVVVDGDELNFYNFLEDENEEFVASFKTWSFFIRRDSDAERAAKKWGEGFEKLKKTESDLDQRSTD
jgi:hypothetical protein